MRFDGYYLDPDDNLRYANYLRFYPQELMASCQFERDRPLEPEAAMRSLRFTHPGGHLTRGRWRRVDSILEIRAKLSESALHPPPPGRPVIPRAGAVRYRGPDGEDRLELEKLTDLHPEWKADRNVEKFTFIPAAGPEEPEAALLEQADRYLLPWAERLNAADGAELVQMDGLWIYRYPVTVGQYRQRSPMPDAPAYGWNNLHPMVGITFDEACRYAEKAGARLLSEAEWQLAAAGPEGRSYPWGDEPDPERLTFHQKRPTWGDRHPDGASWCGALSLAGSVSEWTTDVDRGKRVTKGGSYASKTIEECRCDARRLVQPETAKPWLGFRCVMLSSTAH